MWGNITKPSGQDQIGMHVQNAILEQTQKSIDIIFVYLLNKHTIKMWLIQHLIVFPGSGQTSNRPVSFYNGQTNC